MTCCLRTSITITCLFKVIESKCTPGALSRTIEVMILTLLLIVSWNVDGASAGDFESGERITFTDSEGAIVICSGFGIRKFPCLENQAIAFELGQRWTPVEKELNIVSVLREKKSKQCYFFMIDDSGKHFPGLNGELVLAKVDADTCQELWRIRTGIHVGTLEGKNISRVLGSSLEDDTLNLFVMHFIDSTRLCELHILQFSAITGKLGPEQIVESHSMSYPDEASLHYTFASEESCVRDDAFIVRVFQLRDDAKEDIARPWMMTCVVEQVEGRWKLQDVQHFSDVHKVLPLAHGNFLAFLKVGRLEGRLAVLDPTGSIIPWKSPLPDGLAEFGRFEETFLDLGEDDFILVRGECRTAISWCKFKLAYRDGKAEIAEKSPIYSAKSDLDTEWAFENNFLPIWSGIPFQLDGHVYGLGFLNVSRKFALERFVPIKQ